MIDIATFDPDFDAVYVLNADGTITESSVFLHAPEVILGPDDVSVDSGWHVLTGHTGQQSYNGAVMHASEQWGQWALDDLATHTDNGAVAFCVVEVRDEDGSLPEGDAIGWAVAYWPQAAPVEYGGYVADEGDIGGDRQLSAAPGRRFIQSLLDGTHLVVTEAAYVVPGVDNGEDFRPRRDGYAVENMTEYMHCSDLSDIGGSEITCDYTYDIINYTTIGSKRDALAAARDFIKALGTPQADEMVTP
jgi:hypothetical protein